MNRERLTELLVHTLRESLGDLSDDRYEIEIVDVEAAVPTTRLTLRSSSSRSNSAEVTIWIVDDPDLVDCTIGEGGRFELPAKPGRWRPTGHASLEESVAFIVRAAAHGLYREELTYVDDELAHAKGYVGDRQRPVQTEQFRRRTVGTRTVLREYDAY